MADIKGIRIRWQDSACEFSQVVVFKLFWAIAKKWAGKMDDRILRLNEIEHEVSDLLGAVEHAARETLLAQGVDEYSASAWDYQKRTIGWLYKVEQFANFVLQSLSGTADADDVLLSIKQKAGFLDVEL